MIRLYCIGVLAALTVGCATPPPAPLVKPSTPSALVKDGATGGGRSGGAFFFVAEVAGKPIEDNNLRASMRASAGRGADLRVMQVARYVPAGPTRLRLTGRYAHAAPIQSIFSAAADYAVEGFVDADLRDNGVYRVTGNLDAFKREIWLEDEVTGAVVGAKVVGVATPLAAASGPGLFTCCNLRYDGDWISDANYATLPIIPAGSRIEVKSFGSSRAAVMIEGRPMRIGHDFGRAQETVQQYVGRLTVKDDPRQRLASYPKAIQEAVLAGKVAIGMTKEQAIMSLGYPRTDINKSIDAPEWTYSTLSGEEYILMWAADQTLKSVDATRATRSLVLMGQ